jgi:hypothetical protein
LDRVSNAWSGGYAEIGAQDVGEIPHRRDAVRAAFDARSVDPQDLVTFVRPATEESVDGRLRFRFRLWQFQCTEAFEFDGALTRGRAAGADDPQQKGGVKDPNDAQLDGRGLGQ